MANKVVFTIEGNSTKAVAALNRVASNFGKLDRSASKLNQSSQKTASQFAKAFMSLEKRVASLEGKLGRANAKLEKSRAETQKLKEQMKGLGQSSNQAAAGLNNAANAAAKLSTAGAGAGGGNRWASMNAGLGSFMTGIGKATAATGSLYTGMGRFLSFASKGLSKFRDAWMGGIDAIRLTAQSISNLGRTMMLFVTLPLAAFFGNAFKAAVDFDDAMVRVGKTTGLFGKDLQSVNEGIRELAINTSTSHVELATMAEQIGQLGVSSPKSIVELTDLFNKLAITTDISADTVAEKMGKISNAFSRNLNKSTVEAYKFANVLNELENQTAASADEILTATFKFAQVAAQLNLTEAAAAALGATLVSVGMSDEEAGTALKNMGIYLVKNAEKVSQAMRNNEEYNTTQKVMNALNEDALQVFIDLAKAAKDSPDNAQALQTVMEIGNMRGGRAIMALANGVDQLEKNLAIANNEWSRGTSLIIEYERAMLSTKNQMGVLKNNVNDVGITIGDALLPAINKIIQILVPALRMFGAWFKKLQPNIQMMYIGIALAVVAAGPLLMLFGQLVHAVSLLGMAFGQLIKTFMFAFNIGGKIFMLFGNAIKVVGTRIIPWVAKAITGGLVPALTSLPGIFGRIAVAIMGAFGGLVSFLTSTPVLIIGAVVGAVVIVLKILSKMGVDVAGFFTRLANKAAAWGQRLTQTYANGLARGVAAIVRVIVFIANLIARFFEAHSPPEAGPLKTIDKWGKGLMETYLKGFLLADFDMLNQVGSIIERILTMGVKDDAMGGALKKVAKARVYIAQLISTFNKTGKIAKDVLANITDGLGDMGKHVGKLIVLWLKYNKIQERLKQLEEDKKGILHMYDAEIEAIAATNMSMDSKISAIRAAQRLRDDGLRANEAEKTALEEQSDELKAQLDWQQKFVDTLLDQEDLFNRIAEAVESAAGSMEEMVDALGGAGGEDPLGDVEDSIQKAQEEFVKLEARIRSGGELFNSFLRGFNGEANPSAFYAGVSEEDAGLYNQLYQVGQRLGEVKDKILELKDRIVETFTAFVDWIERTKTKFEETKETIKTWWQSFKDGAEDAKESTGSFFADLEKSYGEFMAKKTLQLFDKLGIDPVVFGQLVTDIVKNMKDIAKAMLAEGGKLAASLWEGFKEAVKTEWGDLVALFEEAAGTETWAMISEGFAYAIETAFGEGSWINSAIESAKDWLQGLEDGFFEGIGTAIEDILLQIDLLLLSIKQQLGISSPSTIAHQMGIDLVQGLINGFVAKVAEFIALIPTYAGQIWTAFYTWWESARAGITAKWAEIIADITTHITNIGVALVGFYETVKTMAVALWTKFIEGLDQKWAEIITGITDWIVGEGGVVETIVAHAEDLWQAGQDLIQGLWNGLQAKWEEVKAWFTTLANAMPAWLKKLLGIKSPSKVMMEIGGQIVEGLMVGLRDNTVALKDTVGVSLAAPVMSVMGQVGGLAAVGVSGNGNAAPISLTVQVNHPVVREDADIDRITKKVSDQLMRNIERMRRNGGHTI